MRPKMPQRVTITTPPEPALDQATGLEKTSPATVATNVPARLSQKPVADVGSQVELLATQNTTVSLWTVLVPAGTVLTSRSTLVDESGREFQIVGNPADRPNHRPQFRAAAARLVSDMQ